MKYIDFNDFERIEHYKFFENVDNPQFNICMNIDVTNF
ncbi:chloramphenicol acetyltransferase, partial [Clostridium botulinum]